MTYLFRIHLAHPTRINGTYCALETVRDAPKVEDPAQVTCRRCYQGWRASVAGFQPRTHLPGDDGRPACGLKTGEPVEGEAQPTCKRCRAMAGKIRSGKAS